jgi:phosphopantothenoylcysteine decarboxylase
MKILLGLTGSVATTVAHKMVSALSHLGDVEIVATENAMYFLETEKINVKVWRDSNEWNYSNGNKVWQKSGDPVRHIDIRKEFGAFVIAPLSANTLAKMANGICDNLLTSIFRAWDFVRPVIVAPAMNSLMWANPFTQEHILKLYSLGTKVKVVPPVMKTLACGDEGVGAMAHVCDIAKLLEGELTWIFPLPKDECSGIPIGSHPGSFGAKRRKDVHTGVDLYCKDDSPVYAVEDGRVIGYERFTGELAGSPWWNDTDAILIEGASGVVCYGEIKKDFATPHVGETVRRGCLVGRVSAVVREGRERPDVPGHSRSMLHLELYKHGRTSVSSCWGGLDEEMPDYMVDPTALLLSSDRCPMTKFDMPNWPEICGRDDIK